MYLTLVTYFELSDVAQVAMQPPLKLPGEKQAPTEGDSRDPEGSGMSPG